MSSLGTLPRQRERIGAKRGDEDERIGKRGTHIVVQDGKAGRQRAGERLLHLGVVGGAPRFAFDLQPRIQKPRRPLFQMRQLLQPEADGAKPLLARRTAFGDLETVLDLEIGEMGLDHAEHGAAVLLGGHETPEASASSRYGSPTKHKPSVRPCSVGARRRLGKHRRSARRAAAIRPARAPRTATKSEPGRQRHTCESRPESDMAIRSFRRRILARAPARPKRLITIRRALAKSTIARRWPTAPLHLARVDACEDCGLPRQSVSPLSLERESGTIGHRRMVPGLRCQSA